jgi:hypothetical protein
VSDVEQELQMVAPDEAGESSFITAEDFTPAATEG